jgi:hypothetical protein
MFYGKVSTVVPNIGDSGLDGWNWPCSSLCCLTLKSSVGRCCSISGRLWDRRRISRWSSRSRIERVPGSNLEQSAQVPTEHNHGFDFWLAGAQFTLNYLSVCRYTPSQEPGRMYKQVFHYRISFCVHDMFDTPGRLVCAGKMPPRVMLAALVTSCLSGGYPPPLHVRQEHPLRLDWNIRRGFPWKESFWKQSEEGGIPDSTTYLTAE